MIVSKSKNIQKSTCTALGPLKINEKKKTLFFQAINHQKLDDEAEKKIKFVDSSDQEKCMYKPIYNIVYILRILDTKNNRLLSLSSSSLFYLFTTQAAVPFPSVKKKSSSFLPRKSVSKCLSKKFQLILALYTKKKKIRISHIYENSLGWIC